MIERYCDRKKLKERKNKNIKILKNDKNAKRERLSEFLNQKIQQEQQLE